MVNHTLLLPNHLDAQPVLSLVRLIALLRNRYKDCLVENGIRIDSVLMYRPLPTWMAASTAAKLWLVPFVRLKRALKGVRGYNKLYSCNAKLAREYAAERHLGVCRTSKKLTELVDIERVFGKSNVATITYDNGAEFSSWRATEKTLAVDVCFADPYKSSVVRVLS